MSIWQKEKQEAHKLFSDERDAYESNDKLEHIVIDTRVPMKWRFVDLETGDIWQWNPASRTFEQSSIPRWFK